MLDRTSQAQNLSTCVLRYRLRLRLHHDHQAWNRHVDEMLPDLDHDQICQCLEIAITFIYIRIGDSKTRMDLQKKNSSKTRFCVSFLKKKHAE